jgi:hypothetical protein
LSKELRYYSRRKKRKKWIGIGTLNKRNMRRLKKPKIQTRTMNLRFLEA